MIKMIGVIIQSFAIMLFCLISGFTLAFGKADSNIKVYYAFTALCLVGVILLR